MMRNPASLLNLLRKLRIGWLAVVGLAFATAGPFGARVVDAQGPPDLEALHQRLLPVFEVAGVVFTDADERSGRLVIGVLDRGVEGLVRGRLRGLGIVSQSVDVVEAEPILQIATLRDYTRPVIAGVQIRFSQYVCSLGFNAIRAGVLGFVTASHCCDRQGTVDGTQYYQPLNQVPAELIGTETVDPAYLRASRAARADECAGIPTRTSARAPLASTLPLAASRRRPDPTTAHSRLSARSISPAADPRPLDRSPTRLDARPVGARVS